MHLSDKIKIFFFGLTVQQIESQTVVYTVYSQNSETPQQLTIRVLNFEQVLSLPVDVSKIQNERMSNSVDPDMSPRSVASDLGLHYLLGRVSPHTYGV